MNQTNSNTIPENKQTTQKPLNENDPYKTGVNYKKEIYFTFSTIALFLLSIIIIIVLSLLTFLYPEKFNTSSISVYIVLLAVLISLIGGLICLDASNPPAPTAMPPQDRKQLIQEMSKGNAAAIDLYMKLRNARGVAGFFQKLGLNGLSIATIFITLTFVILAVKTDGKISENLFDLSKLTIGAFIASFVNRSDNKDKEFINFLRKQQNTSNDDENP